MTLATMLTALVLICDGSKISTCTYQNAIRVLRVAADIPDRVALPGIKVPAPNVQACQMAGAHAAHRAASGLPLGQIATWQCVPTSTANTVATDPAP